MRHLRGLQRHHLAERDAGAGRDLHDVEREARLAHPRAERRRSASTQAGRADRATIVAGAERAGRSPWRQAKISSGGRDVVVVEVRQPRVRDVLPAHAERGHPVHDAASAVHQQDERRRTPVVPRSTRAARGDAVPVPIVVRRTGSADGGDVRRPRAAGIAPRARRRRRPRGGRDMRTRRATTRPAPASSRRTPRPPPRWRARVVVMTMNCVRCLNWFSIRT